MSYPHNIIKDYNFGPLTTRTPILFRLRWLALLAGCVVIGVVAAKNDAAQGTSRVATAAGDRWIEIPLPASQAPHILELDTTTADDLPSDPPASEAPPADAGRGRTAAAQPLSDQPTQSPEQAAAVPELPNYEHTVGRGDTLSGILTEAGFPAADLVALTRLEKAPWRSLRPGQRMTFYANSDGELARLVLHRSETQRVVFTRDGQGFSFEQHDAPTEARRAYAQGVIRDSLFVAGRRAGMPDGLTMDLAHIFGWDIDFALDVRRGDRFTVIYEKIYRGDQFLRTGNILAAEFVNRKRVYRAVRYTPAHGRSDYYTPQGHSMRKAFLRSPLNFTRISSRFSRRRFNPALHKFRAHNGVDYAAPRGTPIWSTGDGKVAFRGNKGGYGKTVIVNHGTRYSTLYAHLRGYAKGIRSGKRIRQGQVIGYVGTTGLSTGPHLHYEFRVNGTHRDPLRVKLPQAKPLPAKEMAGFDTHSTPFWTQMDLLGRTQVALADQ
ncbi:MAG: peptidoglycan DD-metalloendopeptidase family protein [Gammaproteobacteria bacterium]|nr:peptidoglycan DD-metalloendopeptidase family protein [Gammaproteobacteria bacterium]